MQISRRAGLMMLAASLAVVPTVSGAADAARHALVIAYRSAPANWLALRKALRSDALPRFRALQKAGVLTGFDLFFSRGVDDQSWNAMAILNFNGAQSEARWYEETRQTPAGLTQQELALATTIESTPVDLVRDGAGGQTPVNPVFLVIPYKYLVSDAAYREYLDGYTVPQLKGWIEAGILARYSIVQDRFPAGRPWNAMLLLEYRSDAALAARDAVKARVRAKLAHDPTWQAISANKAHIRDELSLTVAEAVQ